jgi:MFS transporter, YNFM family, putative membrane transport protein
VSHQEQPSISIRLLTLILGLSSFASTVSMRLVDPIVPLIAIDLGVGLTQAAMLAPVFTLSYALGQPVIGPVADAFGKMRVIAVSLAVLATLLLLCALARRFDALLALRGLAGVAAGGVIPVAMAALADRVPMAGRQVALARLLSAMVLGQVAGSLLAGTIGEYIGWRATFVTSGSIAGLAALLTFVKLRPRALATRASLNVSSVLARYREVLANPLALRLYALVAVEGMAVFAVFPFTAEILHGRGADGSAEAGIAIAIFGLGGLAYTLVAGPLVARLGPARMAVAGGILLCLVLVIFVLPLPWWSAPALFGLMGLGFYLIHSTFQTQATEISPANRSSAMALFASALFLGTAAGPFSLALLRQIMPLEMTLFIYAAFAAALGFAAGPLLNLGGAQRPR